MEKKKNRIIYCILYHKRLVFINIFPKIFTFHDCFTLKVWFQTKKNVVNKNIVYVAVRNTESFSLNCSLLVDNRGIK